MPYLCLLEIWSTQKSRKIGLLHCAGAHCFGISDITGTFRKHSKLFLILGGGASKIRQLIFELLQYVLRLGSNMCGRVPSMAFGAFLFAGSGEHQVHFHLSVIIFA